MPEANMVTITLEEYFDLRQKAEMNGYLMNELGRMEVVYCKDCARYRNGYCTIRKDSWGATLLVGQHDYCSDGERRTDNG